mgnify:CR=1 FL=1
MSEELSFSKRLRALMKENNIAPQELSEQILVNISTLYRYLDGSGFPKYETLYSISKTFNAGFAIVSPKTAFVFFLIAFFIWDSVASGEIQIHSIPNFFNVF